MPSWLCKIWQFLMNVMGKVLEFALAVVKGLLDLAVAALTGVLDAVGGLLGSPGGILLLVLGGLGLYLFATRKKNSDSPAFPVVSEVPQ